MCRRHHHVGFSIGARVIGSMRKVTAAIAEDQWTPLPYFEPGAAVTEIGWRVFDQHNGTRVRLIVRPHPRPHHRPHR